MSFSQLNDITPITPTTLITLTTPIASYPLASTRAVRLGT